MVVDTEVAQFKRRPTLAVSIITKNSGSKLQRLLAEVSWFADEILVGIDTDTTDDTDEVARRFADTVYYFRHSGQLAFPRMLIFDYTRCDWILSIDDDESLELSFRDILPALLDQDIITHYWFRRKWIVNLDPVEFIREEPWYPDWQLRLFRNDSSLVWKPARAHSGYHVHGPGIFEARAAILHFEPIWCTPEQRAEKLESYAHSGASEEAERHYLISPDARRGLATPPPLAPHRRKHSGAVVHVDIRETPPSLTPDWSFQVLTVDPLLPVRCGESVSVDITLLNTGRLTWMPLWSERSALIHISHHLYDLDDGIVNWDGDRSPLRTIVRPGSATKCTHVFQAPQTAGEYIIRWSLVAEGVTWFDTPQHPPFSSVLQVISLVTPEEG